jgi:hypothetical protein
MVDTLPTSVLDLIARYVEHGSIISRSTEVKPWYLSMMAETGVHEAVMKIMPDARIKFVGLCQLTKDDISQIESVFEDMYSASYMVAASIYVRHEYTDEDDSDNSDDDDATTQLNEKYMWGTYDIYVSMCMS